MTFETTNTGVWAGGPILRNKLFAFGSFEKQDDTRPLSTFRANAGGEPAAGNVTRVLASDLNAISALLSDELRLRHRGLRGYQQADAGQAVPRQGRLQPEQQQQNQLPLQPSRFEHGRPAVDLGVARYRPQFGDQHDVPRLPTVELLDPRGLSVRHRRVERDHRQHDFEQPDHRLHHQRREPWGHWRALSVHRHPGRVERGVHVGRQRAVHAEQRAALQHLPVAGQFHQVHQPPLVHVWREPREVQLRERVLPGQAERLRL